MRTVFFILLLCLLTTSGCVFDDWYWYAECDSEQCQSLEQAINQAYGLEDEATQRFKQEWPEPTALKLEQAIRAAEQSIISCGLPNDEQIKAEAFSDTYPDEIIVSIELFDSDKGGQEKGCRIASSLVYAGARLVLPEIKHQCQVEVDLTEACPPDKLVDDPILAAERAVFLTCLGE